MSETPEATPTALTPLGGLLTWRPPVWDDATRRTVLDELFFEGAEWRPFLARFATLLTLSTVIAAFGLIADSSAVVIGAMLVAPLMTPILGVAGAMVHGDLRRLAVSAAVLLGGTLAAIGVAWAIGWVTLGTMTPNTLTSELLARTVPRLLDLGVAIAAGLAGGYVLTHPRAGSSLPGVAIAVSLVPPLAAVGIALELGALPEARGALLLFTTNMVAIVLAAMVVMVVSGFVPPDVRVLSRGRVRAGFVVVALAVVVVTLPLAAHTRDLLHDQYFTREVQAAVGTWDPAARLVEVQVDLGHGRASVELVVASEQEPRPAWRLAEQLAAIAGHPVDLFVEYRQELRDEATAG